MALFDLPESLLKLSTLPALATFAAGLKQTLADIPGRIRTGAKVVNQSGSLYDWKLAGLRAAVGALATGSRNPSLVFSLHAANAPDKPAILWRDRKLTYSQLDDRMNRIGAGLRR